MHIILRSIVIRLLVFIPLILSLSCDTTNPAANGKPTLTASENPVMIAINWSKSVTITGGSGAYLIKSISDSSIINAGLYFFSSTPKMITIEGKKLGTATVVVQDSAKTAEVEIIVTVATMVASPSSVTVKVGSARSANIQGRTSPYSIDQQPNSAIATVNFSGSWMDIQGIAQGSTSVTIKDNATPSNKVTIPITVIPKPVLTTAGKISFNSTVGNFSFNGIAVEDILTAPVNSEGAGGEINMLPDGANIGIIVGYKKKSQNVIDLIAILFLKSNLSPGTLAMSSSRILYGFDTAVVQIILDGDLTSQEVPDGYLLGPGTLTLSSLSSQKAIGTFSGSGTLIRNEEPVPGNDISVTNGMFDVPLLVGDDFGFAAPTREQERIANFAKKIFKKELIKMKLMKK